jgi:hypothetical protein
MKRHLLPIGLIVLAAILFAPLCRTFVREVVIIPFLYIFWIGKFFVDTIPQIIIWFFFVAILFLILVISFVGKRPESHRGPLPSQTTESRIGAWLKLIEQAREDDYFKWRLGQRLQKLAMRQLAHRNNDTVRDTRNRLRKGTLELPVEITEYFQTSLQPLGNLSRPGRWKFWHRRSPSPLDLDPNVVVTFLEQLETDNQPHREEPRDN